MQTLESRKIEYKKKITEKNTKIKELKDAIVILKMHVSELEKTHSTSSKTSQSASALERNIAESVQNMRDQNGEQKQKIEELETKIEELSKEKTNYEKEIKTLCTKIEELTNSKEVESSNSASQGSASNSNNPNSNSNDPKFLEQVQAHFKGQEEIIAKLSLENEKLKEKLELKTKKLKQSIEVIKNFKTSINTLISEVLLKAKKDMEDGSFFFVFSNFLNEIFTKKPKDHNKLRSMMVQKEEDVLYLKQFKGIVSKFHNLTLMRLISQEIDLEKINMNAEQFSNYEHENSILKTCKNTKDVLLSVVDKSDFERVLLFIIETIETVATLSKRSCGFFMRLIETIPTKPMKDSKDTETKSSNNPDNKNNLLQQSEDSNEDIFERINNFSKDIVIRSFSAITSKEKNKNCEDFEDEKYVDEANEFLNDVKFRFESLNKIIDIKRELYETRRELSKTKASMDTIVRSKDRRINQLQVEREIFKRKLEEKQEKIIAGSELNISIIMDKKIELL